MRRAGAVSLVEKPRSVLMERRCGKGRGVVSANPVGYGSLSPCFADAFRGRDRISRSRRLGRHDRPFERRDRTETQMRRALGLQSTASPPGDIAPTPAPAGPRRPARRFVRDGEVAVSVVHRDAAVGTNRLEAARQALQAQTAVREQAERRLVEAQETIRELQT